MRRSLQILSAESRLTNRWSSVVSFTLPAVGRLHLQTCHHTLRATWSEDVTVCDILSHPIRDLHDDVAAEAVLEAVEDFLATIAHDFREPHAAVHVHEQRSLVQVGRLRVRDDV